jgi:hypothetical protein
MMAQFVMDVSPVVQGPVEPKTEVTKTKKEKKAPVLTGKLTKEWNAWGNQYIPYKPAKLPKKA